MEIKEKQQIKNNEKRFKVNVGNESFVSKVMSFYKKNIVKIHVIVSIIYVLLFMVVFFGELFKYKNGEVTISNLKSIASIIENIRDNAFYSFVVIFAGITPYFFLSAIGVFYGIFIAERLFYRCAVGASLTFTSVLGGTIYCLGASLCIAVGIYYCYLSSKKRKYYNKLGYTFDDIKASFYDLRKDQAKIDEFNKKRKEKIKENEKNNVKIPYIYMILLGVIGFVVETIGTLIAVI